MNIAEELQRLADLRKAGSLTDEEFTDAKRKLLAQNREENDGADKGGEQGSGVADPDFKKTYRSSRWSSGNFFFRDSLVLAADGILFRKGRLFGSSEEHINYKSIASIRVKNGVFLANISVETSGGSQPIFINGLWKSDAREAQDKIRAFQGSA